MGCYPRCIVLLGSLFIMNVSGNAPQILVLGGNGFLGSHAVEALLNKGYNVTILNRGHTYFNSNNDIEPFVHRIITCDRNKLLRQTCKELLEAVKYDVVLDFSSYTDKQIEQVIDILQNKVGLYIFISTDAVYEVREKHHHGKTREEDSKNKIQDKDVDNILQENQYGANKLGCEERLIEQKKRFGFPYVILRLADAVGEKDTTMRWWTYQLLIKIHKLLKLPVPMPKAIMEKKFSMVYAKDVANSIVNMVEKPGVFHGQIINLAFKDDITLRGLLTKIGDCLNISKIEHDYEEKTAWFRYPTVQRGPIDITKAELLLDWEPTNLNKAVLRTCRFFEDAMVDPAYSKEREMMFAEFFEDALPDHFEDHELLLNSLKEAYGPAVFHGIDLRFSYDKDEKRITSTGKNEL